MVIFDVDLLPALAAGPVRRFRINHLYQLSQHTRGDFLDVHVFFCRLQLELLFHYEDDMLTVSENIPPDQPDVPLHLCRGFKSRLAHQKGRLKKILGVKAQCFQGFRGP